VITPCRSSSSSASARRSGVPANSRSVRDQRPCVAVIAVVAAAGSERRPRVVRHLTRPDEVPERGERLFGRQAGLVEQVEPEERSVRERGAQPVMRRALGPRRRLHLAERGCVLAEVERDAVDAGAHPHDLPCRTQRVELLRPVAGHAPRQHLALPQRNRERERLQRHKRLAQRRAPVDAVPGGQEARERRLLDRLDLLAQRGERRAAQAAQDVRIAPLAFAPARPELTAHEQVVALERRENVRHVAAEALVRLRRRERTSPLRIPVDELSQSRYGV
jgi:hypothetical protein